MESEFAKEGAIICRDVLLMSSINEAADNGMKYFREIMEIIDRKQLHFGIGVKNGFKEIVQRHNLRFEMTYGVDNPIFDFVLQSNPFISELVRNLLHCEDFEVVNKSIVISLPGCEDQSWHSDGPHLDIEKHLSCHCLNIFVPLVDVDSTNGPTEIRPRSHVYTRNLAKLYLLAHLKKEVMPNIAPPLLRGSILMVIKLLHTHLLKLITIPMFSLTIEYSIVDLPTTRTALGPC